MNDARVIPSDAKGNKGDFTKRGRKPHDDLLPFFMLSYFLFFILSNRVLFGLIS